MNAVSNFNTSVSTLDPDDPAIYYNLACMYCTMGEIDTAIDMLEKSIEKGFAAKTWIQNDGDLMPLRNHPRYIDLLNKLSN